MEVTTKVDGDTMHIKISGTVDTDGAEILRTKLSKISFDKPSKVVMDLTMVPMMGSSGIGKILLFYKNLVSMNTTFEIKGIQANLYNIFKAVKLDKLFPISLK
jgi:anti-sigma B factor antagonist